MIREVIDNAHCIDYQFWGYVVEKFDKEVGDHDRREREGKKEFELAFKMPNEFIYFSTSINNNVKHDSNEVQRRHQKG